MSTGLPLLSGPPPQAPDADACRKCNKEFNMLFNRQKQCNHCGYLYCSTCTDYSALMPREHGYDTKPVCSFCIELLTITAAPKNALKSSQMAKLKKYLAAYNIRTDRVVEKDDLVNAILGARSPNGCLRREYEDYYRRHSVPDRTSGARPRGVFSRPTNAPTPPSPADPRRTTTFNNRTTFARPDLEPDPPHYAPPSGPPPSSRPAPRQSYPPHASPSTPQANSGQRSTSGNNNASPRPPPPPQARPSPPPPPPTMEQLLEMTAEQVSSLSVSALKAVLFANHVNTGIGVLEKSELVNKVHSLIGDERRDRARREAEEEYERQQQEAQRTAHAEELRREQEEMDRVLAESLREHNESQRNTPQDEQRPEQQSDVGVATPPPSSPEPAASPPPPPKMTPAAQSMATQLERTGLCVICQDDEANIAIVDCGHLCLCRGCSDIVMANTRECPLCRTRIVTESRLLRIFRT